jgi:hypothetical protein
MIKLKKIKKENAILMDKKNNKKKQNRPSFSS